VFCASCSPSLYWRISSIEVRICRDFECRCLASGAGKILLREQRRLSEPASKVRSFSRLGPRRSALDYDGLLLATLENVGSQFLSLRQFPK
jgi:hypothetical protein